MQLGVNNWNIHLLLQGVERECTGRTANKSVNVRTDLRVTSQPVCAHVNQGGPDLHVDKRVLGVHMGSTAPVYVDANTVASAIT